MIFMNTEVTQWNLSPNNIVVRFPPLAGGKFLITMLSYYEKFMYPLPIIYIHQLIDTKDLEQVKSFTHAYAMHTIPNKDNRHKWEFFEMFVHGFYRFNFGGFAKNAKVYYKTSLEDSHKIIPEVTLRLLEKYFCFHVQHNDYLYNEIKDIIPNGKILNLTDYTLLQALSSRFKIDHKQSDRHLPLLESQEDVINFSMKNVFNKNKFFDDVSNLALTISGNDKFDSKMEEYYDAYINIHKL